MADPKEHPIKEKETIIINKCQVCGTRYSLEEAKSKNMKCCDKPLSQIEERVPTPMGP